MENKEVRDNLEFREALEFCRKNNLYLGEGNPNAKILIIGQECASDKESLKEQGIECKDPDNELELCVVKNNLDSWDNILKIENLTTKIEAKKEFVKSESKKAGLEENIVTKEFYPIYPHLGQQCSFRTKATKKGTAPTWYFYQRLIDMILNKKSKDKTEIIDFHDKCFHTELSQIPLKGNSNISEENKYNRAESIAKRIELFKMPFFKQFSIVIIGVGHYTRVNNFDIQDLFDVHFQGESIIVKSTWYNIHYQNEGSARILIHTRQLSNGVSYPLLKAIASESKGFI